MIQTGKKSIQYFQDNFESEKIPADTSSPENRNSSIVNETEVASSSASNSEPAAPIINVDTGPSESDKKLFTGSDYPEKKSFFVESLVSDLGGSRDLIDNKDRNNKEPNIKQKKNKDDANNRPVKSEKSERKAEKKAEKKSEKKSGKKRAKQLKKQLKKQLRNKQEKSPEKSPAPKTSRENKSNKLSSSKKNKSAQVTTIRYEDIHFVDSTNPVWNYSLF